MILLVIWILSRQIGFFECFEQSVRSGLGQTTVPGDICDCVDTVTQAEKDIRGSRDRFDRGCIFYVYQDIVPYNGIYVPYFETTSLFSVLSIFFPQGCQENTFPNEWDQLHDWMDNTETGF